VEVESQGMEVHGELRGGRCSIGLKHEEEAGKDNTRCVVKEESSDLMTERFRIKQPLLVNRRRYERNCMIADETLRGMSVQTKKTNRKLEANCVLALM
jgi:hypothetical protein